MWGEVACETGSRYTHSTTGGDPSPKSNGASQGNTAYRRLSVNDGDDVWGESCELARNNHANGENTGSQTSGTFALYESGDHKITFFSQRYTSGFSSSVNQWQTVAQMKQTQPYDSDGNPGVALEIQIWGNQLRLDSWWSTRWSTPAPVANTWIRYALDVVYSKNPSVGSVKLYVDRNGDGDWLDSGEQSPRISVATLATESAGSAGDGLAVGDAIPSHLRTGIYHNVPISCPAPTGCPVELDNVQVVDA